MIGHTSSKLKAIKPQSIIYNIAEGAEVAVLGKLLEAHSHLLYIRSTEELAAQTAANVRFFLGSVTRVINIPAWDTNSYDPISPGPLVLYKRLEGLMSLLKSRDGSSLTVLSAKSLMQKFIPPEDLLKYEKVLKVGGIYRIEELASVLQSFGYNRSVIAENPGDFAVRGGIIDLVMGGTKEAYRLGFSGNTLEAIKVFDPATQLSHSKKGQITVLPAGEVIFTFDNIENFKRRYEEKFGGVKNAAYEAVIRGVRQPGIEYWLPLFHKNLSTIFDYLPEGTEVIQDLGTPEIMDALTEELISRYKERLHAALHAEGFFYSPLPPENLYLSAADKQLITKREGSGVLTLSSYKGLESASAFNVSRTPNIYLESKVSGAPIFSLLSKYLENTEEKRVLIACSREDNISWVAQFFKTYGVVAYKVENKDALCALPRGAIGLAILPLEKGCLTEKLIVYSEQDLFGTRPGQSKTAHKKQKKVRVLQMLNQLQPEELVVHIEYGLGRFKGLKALEVKGAIHDFIEIVYHNDDKLYLPVENFELLSKYGPADADIQLDRLGSLAWQNRRARLKERIKLAAEVLLKTAAARYQVSAVSLEAEKGIYEEFCQRSPYVETSDQERAITEVLEDLASTQAMDRLICGDVGFGKTEVALRAACASVLGKTPMQVAIVVPTTLLARQHTKTFTERFAGFPVKIKQLSKFTRPSEVKDIKRGLKAGEVDIVIGTHALLAKDIEFARLGLVIIDEEQHFGVVQKEKLKQIKSNAHVLTLSATPIPRTLQMAIAGIRGLSIIASPPVERQPVETFVMPYDGVMLREALLREKMRGGRSFYVTPRISYIDDIARKLAVLVPELKVVVASGAMSASALDQIMNDFYDGEYDVLLSTTIIESGLDITAANTLIVDRADMFGLAQLYQIRGRVGRSDIKAYAYFTFSPNTNITQLAIKKLAVLASLTELGAGMSVASHDMDLRGYGNLLGQEQSGHIKEVGVELYQAMLADAVEALKAAPGVGPQEEKDWSPNMNLGIAVQLPQDYIADDSLRLNMYRQIASLTTAEEIEGLERELEDRFGPLPKAGKNLLQVVALKQDAKLANIKQIDVGDNGFLISFHNNKPSSHDKLLQFITSHGNCKFRADSALFIKGSGEDAGDDNKIAKLQEIVKKLI